MPDSPDHRVKALMAAAMAMAGEHFELPRSRPKAVHDPVAAAQIRAERRARKAENFKKRNKPA